MVGMFYGEFQNSSFSVFGPSLPFAAVGGTFLARCRYWHKADIPEPPINVRFWGKSGRLLDRAAKRGSVSAMKFLLTVFSNGSTARLGKKEAAQRAAENAVADDSVWGDNYSPVNCNKRSDYGRTPQMMTIIFSKNFGVFEHVRR